MRDQKFFGNIEVVNLTPHTVSIMLEDDSRIDIPASGQLARCKVSIEQTGTIGLVPLTGNRYGEVEGLPEATKDTIFIVSALVANAVPDRGDVFIPNEAIRDEEGRIIGCKSLGHV